MNSRCGENSGFRAAYLDLAQSGELAGRAAAACEVRKRCTLCPRECRVDRTSGGVGACGVGADALVSSYNAHFGEESVLVGRYGSGTIFFAGCNLHCVFCQNYEISRYLQGHTVSVSQLADMMLDLQDIGCHNINLVTPTHQVPQIISAVEVAAGRGLRVPLVYNCGGYELVNTLGLLDGIVDIYMPDMKYGDNEPGRKYSGVPDYWDRSREAVLEMHRQVGDLEIRNLTCDDDSSVAVAVRGLMVRHLVLPDDIGRTENLVTFLAREVSKDTYVNIMAQYRPEFQAHRYPELNRPITREEYRAAMAAARRAGLHRFAD